MADRLKYLVMKTALMLMFLITILGLIAIGS